MKTITQLSTQPSSSSSSYLIPSPTTSTSITSSSSNSPDRSACKTRSFRFNPSQLPLTPRSKLPSRPNLRLESSSSQPDSIPPSTLESSNSTLPTSPPLDPNLRLTPNQSSIPLKPLWCLSSKLSSSPSTNSPPLLRPSLPHSLPSPSSLPLPSSHRSIVKKLSTLTLKSKRPTESTTMPPPQPPS